jgi:hypothetical protein
MPPLQTKKKPGPPATGKGISLNVRLQPVPLSALDAFVADQNKPVSRPEAIRVILMKFFRSKGYLPRTS